MTTQAPKAGFKKGVSGNPNGRPPISAQEKIIKGLTKEAVVKLAELVLVRDLEHLKRIPKKPNAPVLEVMLASICVKIIEKGDMHAFQELLNRLIGKVKDEVKHSGTINGNAKVIITLPDNGRGAAKELKE